MRLCLLDSEPVTLVEKCTCDGFIQCAPTVAAAGSYVTKKKFHTLPFPGSIAYSNWVFELFHVDLLVHYPCPLTMVIDFSTLSWLITLEPLRYIYLLTRAITFP